jgi:hypothetical protein
VEGRHYFFAEAASVEVAAATVALDAGTAMGARPLVAEDAAEAAFCASLARSSLTVTL